MNYIPLEVTLMNAVSLKNANIFSKMRVYAVLSVTEPSNHEIPRPGKPRYWQETPVSEVPGRNPSWDNFQLRFYVEELKLKLDRCEQRETLLLVIQLRCKQSFGTDKDIGEVRVPLKELFDKAEENKFVPCMTYEPVVTRSGKPKGVLCFSFNFGKSILGRADEERDIHHVQVPKLPVPSAPVLPEMDYF